LVYECTPRLAEAVVDGGGFALVFELPSEKPSPPMEFCLSMDGESRPPLLLLVLLLLLRQKPDVRLVNVGPKPSGDVVWACTEAVVD